MISKLLAQNPPAQLQITRWPTTNLGGSIPEIATNILQWLLGFAGGLAVLAVIYSGFLYITSGGDSSQAETAKKNMTWAIIGVVLISLAYFIVGVVQDTLLSAAPVATNQTQVQSSQATQRAAAIQTIQNALQAMQPATNTTTQQEINQIQSVLQQMQNGVITTAQAVSQIQQAANKIKQSGGQNTADAVQQVLQACQILTQVGSSTGQDNTAETQQIQVILQQLQNNPTPQQAAELGRRLQQLGYDISTFGGGDLGSKLQKIGNQIQAGANIISAIEELNQTLSQYQRPTPSPTYGGGDVYTGEYTPPSFEEPWSYPDYYEYGENENVEDYTKPSQYLPGINDNPDWSNDSSSGASSDADYTMPSQYLPGINE